MSQDNTTPRTFLKLRDATSAAALRNSLFAAVANPTPAPLYVGSLHADNAAWHVANAIGMSRMLLKAMRGQKASENQGKQALQYDAEGALAELLVGLALERAAGVNLAPLVAHKPDSTGLDINLDGVLIDVKSVGQSQPFLNINAAAHQRKPPDLYLAVKVASPRVLDLLAVSAELVSTQFRLVPGSRGMPFYSAALSGLMPRLEPLPDPVAA